MTDQSGAYHFAGTADALEDFCILLNILLGLWHAAGGSEELSLCVSKAFSITYVHLHTLWRVVSDQSGAYLSTDTPDAPGFF